MSKINRKMGTGSALVIALLAFGAFVGAAALVSKSQFNFASITSADEGEDSGDSNDGDDEDKPEDEDKNDDSEDKAKEETKKKIERERESAKKQLERSNESSDDDSEDSDIDDESNDVGEVEEDDNGDNNGMFKDRAKTLAKLQKEIDEARKNILEKQAEGADVTAALARLALAEAGLTQVGTSFDANNLAAVKMLAKQIKKTAHFTEKDMEFSKKVTEEMAKVEKRFGQVDKKISTLESLSGDASAFKAQFASLRSDFSVLKASLTATPGTVTRDVVRAFETRVKRLKSLIEGTIFALGGTDDDDLFDDHEDDADDLSEDLNDVAEIEDGDDNGVSGKVRKVAVEHKAASKAIKESLEDINGRDGIARVVFGPDFNALDSLNAQITAMSARAATLEATSAQITDLQIRQILVDQAKALRSEVAKLQAYITAEDNQFSIFGKFLSLFR